MIMSGTLRVTGKCTKELTKSAKPKWKNYCDNQAAVERIAS